MQPEQLARPLLEPVEVEVEAPSKARRLLGLIGGARG